jgi:MFS superfamily sulfate permease-like transporter
VVDVLKRFRLYELIGEANIHPTQVLAVRHIYADAHSRSTEKDCPLKPLRPHVAELSLHSDGSLRDADRWNLDRCRCIAGLRFDGSLDASGSEYLLQKVEECVARMPDLKIVLFAAHRIHQIDAVGAEKLRKMTRWLRDSGYDVAFSGLADDVHDLLQERGVMETLGDENVYPTQILAIRHIYDKAHSGAIEKSCPLDSLRPYIAELSLHPDGSFRDAERHGLKQCERIAALRYDGPLDRPASEFLAGKVEERISKMAQLRHVFFAAHKIHQIDRGGVQVLTQVIKKLKDSGYGISFSGLSDDIIDTLKQSQLWDLIGEENIYPTQTSAIEAIHSATHANSDEKRCPLLEVVFESPVTT